MNNVNQDQIKANLLSTSFWIRVLFMLIFALVLWALWLAAIVICVVQTVIVLITGEINEQLQKLGAIAAQYLSQIVSFMVFATEDKPFPFSPFPENGSSKSGGEPKTGTVMPSATDTPKKDIPVLSDAVKEDDNDDDSFYDPARDSGAAR